MSLEKNPVILSIFTRQDDRIFNRFIFLKPI